MKISERTQLLDSAPKNAADVHQLNFANREFVRPTNPFRALLSVGKTFTHPKHELTHI